MNLNIVCIPGDGIGPEIVAEAKKVLHKSCPKVWSYHFISRYFNGGSFHRCLWGTAYG